MSNEQCYIEVLRGAGMKPGLGVAAWLDGVLIRLQILGNAKGDAQGKSGEVVCENMIPLGSSRPSATYHEHLHCSSLAIYDLDIRY